MAVEVFANQPTATVTSGGTTAPSAGTVETWTAPSWAAFAQAATGSTQYHIYDETAGKSSELILVENTSGTSATVVRGAEGTTPVAHSAPFTVTQAITANWLNSAVIALQPTGDATGVLDTAFVNAAIAQIGSTCGRILLDAGTFYWTCGSVVVTNPGVYVEGAGRWATIVMAVGTGDTFRAYTTSNYSGSGGGPAGGCLKGLTFDGTNAGAGSSGFHVGDLYNYEFRVGTRHFQGTGSIAAWLDNRYAVNGMEQMTGLIWAETSTTCAQFDVNPASGHTPTGSFDRANLTIFVDGKGKGDLVKFNNGAFCTDGNIGIYGNTDYGASTFYALTLTGPGTFSFTATNASPAVFTVTGFAFANGTPVQLAGGSLPAGFTATTYYVVAASGNTFELAATSGGSAINSTSSGSGTVQSLTYSGISNSTLNIGVECNGTTGTQPGTIKFGTIGPAGNYILGCTGIIDFSGNNPFANASGYGENFQFDGPISGDTFLHRTIGFGVVPYQQGAITNGNIIVTRYNSITRVQPAGNVTGAILSGFDPLSSQVFWLINDSAFTVTFAAQGTSNVVGGTSVTVAAGTAMQFLWSDNDTAWFPVGSTSGGGGGTVTSVTAGDTSIVVGGTSSAPTIETGTLDVIAADHPPAANWSNNSHKITGGANGTVSTDFATFGQIPVVETTAANILPDGVQAAGANGKWADSGHVHQNNADLSLLLAPSGATGETVSRSLCGGYLSGLTSSLVYVSALPLAKGTPVNNITLQLGNLQFTLVDVTHGWYALLDSSRVVRAVSADQASGNWGPSSANLPVTLSVAGSSYTTTYGGLYYVALCITFTSTSGEFVQSSITSVGGMNTTAPLLCGTSSTGQTTPPSTGTTMGAITGTTGGRFYAYTS